MGGVVTRKQHLVAALAAPLKATRRVRTAEDLEELATLFRLNPALADAMDTLDIVLHYAFSPAPLRKSMVSLPNLTDFILIAPSLRSSAPLQHVHLPQLQYFRTDLPHHTLLAFLQAHPTIVDLDILDDPHRGSLCPLQSISLAHIQCLSGPTRCVPRLAHKALTRLTIELPDEWSGPSLSVRTLSAPWPQLYRLIIDIHDDDPDILQNIARACPGLRKLKLVEKPSKTRTRALVRRAWKDTAAWSKTLRKLYNLEELFLRTHAPLVHRTADIGEERKVIAAWVDGHRPTSGRTPPKAHPMLYHVAVWYNARKYGGGCVTHWSKLPTGWERVLSVMDPDRDHLFY